MTPRARPRLRDLTSADSSRVHEITAATGVFREEELEIAAEVFRDCVAAPGPSGGGVGAGVGAELQLRPYYALGAELENRLVGWICWGQTPCTEGTWDLYWMAVDPAAQGAGVGSALVLEMERRLTGRARLVSVDTSGRADYGPTRAFYEAVGYRAVARVPDFYAPGDDQV
ncbi:MAG: GNAT family N-acetyltransferase, partial [Gemmatimonadota bacterium]|nr:GNAT family N-acetyltransferase [Gemmatimonadota bacterium]